LLNGFSFENIIDVVSLHTLLIFIENNPLPTLILVLSSKFEYDNYQLLSITGYEKRINKTSRSGSAFVYLGFYVGADADPDSGLFRLFSVKQNI
jgi:hypothetical protein